MKLRSWGTFHLDLMAYALLAFRWGITFLLIAQTRVTTFWNLPGMVVHPCHSCHVGYWETEAGGLRAQGQPGLQRDHFIKQNTSVSSPLLGFIMTLKFCSVVFDLENASKPLGNDSLWCWVVVQPSPGPDRLHLHSPFLVFPFPG